MIYDLTLNASEQEQLRLLSRLHGKKVGMILHEALAEYFQQHRVRIDLAD